MLITSAFLSRAHPETFRAKCGAPRRLDYALLQRTTHDCVASCYVMTDLDFVGKSPDHWLVVVVDVVVARRYTPPEPGRPKLDRQKLADPLRQNESRQALGALP
eukprot:2251730-Pyramimonas_sp.AAC.1